MTGLVNPDVWFEIKNRDIDRAGPWQQIVNLFTGAFLFSSAFPPPLFDLPQHGADNSGGGHLMITTGLHTTIRTLWWFCLQPNWKIIPKRLQIYDKWLRPRMTPLQQPSPTTKPKPTWKQLTICKPSPILFFNPNTDPVPTFLKYWQMQRHCFVPPHTGSKSWPFVRNATSNCVQNPGPRPAQTWKVMGDCEMPIWKTCTWKKTQWGKQKPITITTHPSPFSVHSNHHSGNIFMALSKSGKSLDREHKFAPRIHTLGSFQTKGTNTTTKGRWEKCQERSFKPRNHLNNWLINIIESNNLWTIWETSRYAITG